MSERAALAYSLLPVALRRRRQRPPVASRSVSGCGKGSPGPRRERRSAARGDQRPGQRGAARRRCSRAGGARRQRVPVPPGRRPPAGAGRRGARARRPPGRARSGRDRCVISATTSAQELWERARAGDARLPAPAARRGAPHEHRPYREYARDMNERLTRSARHGLSSRRRAVAPRHRAIARPRCCEPSPGRPPRRDGRPRPGAPTAVLHTREHAHRAEHVEADEQRRDPLEVLHVAQHALRDHRRERDRRGVEHAARCAPTRTSTTTSASVRTTSRSTEVPCTRATSAIGHPSRRASRVAAVRAGRGHERADHDDPDRPHVHDARERATSRGGTTTSAAVRHRCGPGGASRARRRSARARAGSGRSRSPSASSPPPRCRRAPPPPRTARRGSTRAGRDRRGAGAAGTRPATRARSGCRSRPRRCG